MADYITTDDAVSIPKGSVLMTHNGDKFVVTDVEDPNLTVRPYRWYDWVVGKLRRLWRRIRR